MKNYLLILLAALACTGCAQDTRQYARETPALAPDRFFNGHLVSHGFFQDWKGQATKRFKMEADAKWDGDHGMMHERFTFADGNRQERHWTFSKQADNTFIGTAPDVDGEARGTVYGNSLHWVYTITLNVDGSSRKVLFDDWLYLIDDNHMFSLVDIHKFGLPVGKLTMFFDRTE